MRRALAILAAALAGAVCAAPAGAVGLKEIDVGFSGPDGTAQMQAGSHPFAFTTAFKVETAGEAPDGSIKDLVVDLPPGLAVDPRALPRCPAADFLVALVGAAGSACPDDSAVGVVEVQLEYESPGIPIPVYNLAPPPGAAAQFGFHALGTVVTIRGGVRPHPPYNPYAGLRNISQAEPFFGSLLTLWGVPGDAAHDEERGNCLTEGGRCRFPGSIRPLITLPTRCAGPLATVFQIDPWSEPGNWLPPYTALTHDDSEPPAPLGPYGCSRLAFSPRTSAEPTTRAAQSPSGLDFGLDVEDEGLRNPNQGATAQSQIRRAEVALPAGMTLNPSQAEGLEVCSEAELARESASSGPGEGCPEASKVGTIEVETPLLEGTVLKGSLYVAEPYKNLAEDSLIAVYVVIKDAGLGVLVTQPLKVSPDPQSGQLITTAAQMPQVPFSHFRLHFREGARAPLISPPGCGRFETVAKLYPWSGGPPATSTSAFEIISGPGESACPSGPAPFSPGFQAGTANNAAGSYSPFAMRITRGDGMQDLSKFSAVLPPGVVGKIAGIPWCPDAGIAQAKGRTGEDGGRDELSDPSCPAASLVGRTTAGAGVGSQLTYVPGSLYLAGPYKGAPLSVVSITPAVAGPFDAGTVVVRVGLDLNPITGVVEADGSRSDPIPHILQGIPLNVRDLRVYTDRPGFTLNATSCEESNTWATLWGAGTVIDPSFETPVARAARYQAAGCASLGFSPKLGIKLKGGVKRGKFPALRAHYRPKAGEANLKRLALTFPTSAFIEQGHFRTICTRVQFAAGSGHGSECPKGARYGTARVWTPLLDGPLRGPVYLRSSDHNLPDAVFTLTGPPSAPIQIEVSVRIDSVKGRLRATVEDAPDAPVSRAIVDMQGGQKGLFVNSRHLCHKPKRNRVRANLRGQNGKLSRTNPRAVAVACAKRRKAKRARARRSAGHVSRARAAGAPAGQRPGSGSS